MSEVCYKGETSFDGLQFYWDNYHLILNTYKTQRRMLYLVMKTLKHVKFCQMKHQKAFWTHSETEHNCSQFEVHNKKLLCNDDIIMRDRSWKEHCYYPTIPHASSNLNTHLTGSPPLFIGPTNKWKQ